MSKCARDVRVLRRMLNRKTAMFEKNGSGTFFARDYLREELVAIAKRWGSTNCVAAHLWIPPRSIRDGWIPGRYECLFLFEV